MNQDARRSVPSLQQCAKFLNCQTGLSDDVPEGAFGQFYVSRDGESSMGRMGLSQDDMASGLVIDQIADFLQCANRILP